MITIIKRSWQCGKISVRDTAKINISCLRWHCIKEEPLFWHGNHCMESGTLPEIVCEHCSPCHPQMQVKVQSCNEETDVWQCDEDPEMLPCSLGQSSFKMDRSSVVRQAEDYVFFRKTILNCILKLFQEQSFVVKESGLSEVQTFGCFLCFIVNKMWFLTFANHCIPVFYFHFTQHHNLLWIWVYEAARLFLQSFTCISS